MKKKQGRFVREVERGSIGKTLSGPLVAGRMAREAEYERNRMVEKSEAENSI